MKSIQKKRNEANARNEARAKRGDKAQLASLPQQGNSKREIARLTNRIAAAVVPMSKRVK